MTPTIIDVAVLDRTRWQITGSGTSVIVNTVTIVGNTIVLGTTAMVAGGPYTLIIPNTTIAESVGGTVFLGSFSQPFTGAGATPVILITRVIDARTIEVTYDQAVNKYDALNETNYSINNGLSVLSVAQVSTAIFTLTTTKQVDGTAYTLTASNIRSA